MIIGIGTDLARVERFARASKRHGPRFAERLLGESELGQFHGHPLPAAFLAKRFAAKEAFVKALGTGLRLGMRWTEIQVASDALGRPTLLLSGKAHELAMTAGVRSVHLSLSDESDLALAFVVLEG
ncbi:holo-ACP synthase [Halomonas urumqiensis]|uniref:Holo-[acyl-carrier-protein] synthase n=1 Tax=Halomonas urumqiensis TaxID=1684789 RepID=A0A2N7UQZ0_9GAMM|nr:holo-ACP synthase [Halomonas urumqiensis]PMR82853.1 holo-ACP synthase [Halomonas urumqiensis]PTB01829.1 holo-ACP synthase [Halomonas urumqiensis]GHE21930.1 holo-[acyl-carrier-protein] synthase [Halomonas urumqiensis]